MSGTSEQDLQTAIVNFVAWLRQTFPDDYSQDRLAFERRAAKIFKKEIISQRQGRPRKEIVTLAAEMHRDRKSWSQIYGLCLAADIKGADRGMAQLRLRSAVRTRLWREQQDPRVQNVTPICTQTKPPRECSS